jgi:hypothetical protein
LFRKGLTNGDVLIVRWLSLISRKRVWLVSVPCLVPGYVDLVGDLVAVNAVAAGVSDHGPIKLGSLGLDWL